MEVRFYNMGEIDDRDLKFAVISAFYKNKWIFVRHRERITWEIPGGHREEGEDITCTAFRELNEETGAKDYNIIPLCDYGVVKNGSISFGRLFFADIRELGELPDMEIAEIRLFDEMPESLTYQDIQPHLYRQTLLLSSK